MAGNALVSAGFRSAECPEAGNFLRTRRDFFAQPQGIFAQSQGTSRELVQRMDSASESN